MIFISYIARYLCLLTYFMRYGAFLWLCSWFSFPVYRVYAPPAPFIRISIWTLGKNNFDRQSHCLSLAAMAITK
jgi:hypothetical protein